MIPRLLPVSAHVLYATIEKIANVTRILTYCIMECLAGPYNGKTTLNCEYRIIHTKKKGKKIHNQYNMSYQGCDVMLRYLP